MSLMLINFISKPVFRQLVVYFLTGVLINGLGLFVFFLFVEFGINSKLSMSILYVVGVAGSYASNKNIGFKNKEKHSIIFIKFSLVYIIGYCFNLFAHIYFVDILYYSPYLIQGVMVIVISLFVFVAFKFFVFG